MIKTPKSIAEALINNTNVYQLNYSSERSNVKNLRKVLASLHEDIELLLSVLDVSERTEDLNKKLVALKEISEAKKLNENRVRFWLNMMLPDLKKLAEKSLNKINENKS